MTGDPVAAFTAAAAPASTSTPAPTSSATSPPSSPATPPAPPRPPNKAWAWMKRQWGKVTATTTKKPELYKGRRLSRMINEELDGRGKVHGPAHRAMFGESVSLVVENVVHGGDATTPLGFLTGSSIEYAWTVWDEAPHKDKHCPHGGPHVSCPACNAPPPAPPTVLQPVDKPDEPTPAPAPSTPPTPPAAPAAAPPISQARRRRARSKKGAR